MPQLYWIIPMEGGPPPGQPPIASTGPGFIGNPIVIPPAPGQPPGIWVPVFPSNLPSPGGPGGPPPQMGNPIYLPGPPAGIWVPTFPSNPITNPGDPNNPGGRPPGTWGGGGVGDYIDAGLPPAQPLPPDELPGLPEPPAAIADKIVVAIHKPGEEWVVKAYDANAHPDQGLPPYARPKR